MIKFRAWDKNENRYFVDGNAGRLGNLICCNDWDMFDPDDYVWEQFTGLIDVNGKDIYEGDIVHCKNEYQGTDYTGKVMFFNGGFCVWTGGFRNYVWEDMIPEIIGNVHNSHELLED